MSTNLETLLEDERFPAIAGLYSWSTNYSFPTPFSLYLDLIGYSEEELGERICADKNPNLGYLELDHLADALREYSAIGQDAYDFSHALVTAEVEG